MKIKDLSLGVYLLLVVLLAGCATQGESVSNAGTAQAKAAAVSVKLQAILTELAALEPAAAGAATIVESVVAPELVPVTQAVSAAVQVANRAAGLSAAPGAVVLPGADAH